jgi:glycosyltransferase involved in cell wall biosynthesis
MIEPPLPFGSAPSRWYYVLLKGLLERGHRVTAFATSSKPEDLRKAAELFPAPRFALRCYAHPVRSGISAKLETLVRPYSYMFSPEMKTELAKHLAAGYDILHLEQLWSGWLGLEHSPRALVNVHHLEMIDLENAPSLSRRMAFDRRLMFSSEKRLIQRFKWFRSCSGRLVPRIRQINPGASIATVPVGIDTLLYPFLSDQERPVAPTITLIASMDWYPGASAARRLLTKLYPLIKKQVPRARFEIVGWFARSVLKEYLELPDVQIVENVADTIPYFHKAAAFVYAPQRGSGMKIKVLEAMALGAPVVTTPEGVEGLCAEDGIHAQISDSDEGLAERTIDLLQDRTSQNRQRRAARELIDSWCSPERTLGMIEQIYSQMVAG